MNWIIIIFVFVGAVFVVVGGMLLTIVLRAVLGSQSLRTRSSYRPEGYSAESANPLQQGTFEIMDDCIDTNPAWVGPAVDVGYVQADIGNMNQQAVDAGGIAQQGTDLGALGSSAVDMSAASNAGWDAGSAAGASMGTDMSSSFTGSVDSGMSGSGMDSGSSSGQQ